MSEAAIQTALRQRLDAVEARLRQACTRAGRRRDEVTLIAVTKTVSPAVAALLPALGVLDLGENRPQELWKKAALLPPEVRWHLIGHLQRNKIDRTLPLVQRIHSVDSARLLEALDAATARRGSPDPAAPATAPLSVLLEVNASGEASKGGFPPDALPALIPTLQSLRHLRVDGLMTMAAYEEDPERCRPTFRALRRVRDELRAAVGSQHPMEHLSMGMSNDFEIAIEEGATLVRLGSVLFEGVEGE